MAQGLAQKLGSAAALVGIAVLTPNQVSAAEVMRHSGEHTSLTMRLGYSTVSVGVSFM